MGEPFSDEDTTARILSLLPLKSLMAIMCTSKRFYNFVYNPLFLRFHYRSSSKQIHESLKQILVLQNRGTPLSPHVKLNSIYLLTLVETGHTLNKFLDFLPEKVIILSSSNGLLCCRSWDDRDGFKPYARINFVTYVCNPITKRCVQFRSRGDKHESLVPGLAFYPFGDSSSSSSMFKLVNIECSIDYSKSNPFTYSFHIYSSDTNKWKTSKEVCMLTSKVCMNRSNSYACKVVFANGWLHWLTPNYLIMAFHVEKELSRVIKLPCAPARYLLNTYTYGFICWGESEGYFHYVYACGPQLQVWILKDYDEEPAWELKYWLDMDRFVDQHLSGFYRVPHKTMHVFQFHEDVLYFRCLQESGSDYDGYLFTCDFRTKTLKNHGIIARESAKDDLLSPVVFPFHSDQACPIVFPFSPSLLPLHELAPFKVRRSKRNGKRKLREKL